MPPLALLLDFDGVIVDSENYHIAAWQRTLHAMGRDASDERCQRAAEIDDRVFLTEVLDDEVGTVDFDGWLRRKEDLTEQMLADSPRLYGGVRALILKVHSLGIPVAVVSTSRRENISSVLKATGLEGAITLIVGKQDVQALKPDPESYLLAIRSLGLQPGEAVAIEDSKTGLDSAQAAGLRTIIVGHRHKTGNWHGDAVYLQDFRNTAATLAAIGLDSADR